MAKVPLREAIMEIVHNQVRDGTPPEPRLTSIVYLPPATFANAPRN